MKVTIITGPQSSGKSTMAREYAGTCSMGHVQRYGGLDENLFLRPAEWLYGNLDAVVIEEWQGLKKPQLAEMLNNGSVWFRPPYSREKRLHDLPKTVVIETQLSIAELSGFIGMLNNVEEILIFNIVK